MLDFLYYPVSFVMRLWHELFGALFGPATGLSWALSVVFLVLTVRALLVRSAWTRMRAARIGRALAPQVARLRERHRGDARALAEATAALHRTHGSSPVAGLGVVFLQIPVFVALLHVLRSFNRPGLTFELVLTRLLDRRPPVVVAPPAPERGRAPRPGAKPVRRRPAGARR